MRRALRVVAVLALAAVVLAIGWLWLASRPPERTVASAYCEARRPISSMNA